MITYLFNICSPAFEIFDGECVGILEYESVEVQVYNLDCFWLRVHQVVEEALV